MWGFVEAAEQGGLLPMDPQGREMPLSCHGAFSHYGGSCSTGFADYQSFPNMSGGAVTRNGALVGIHIAA